MIPPFFSDIGIYWYLRFLEALRIIEGFKKGHPLYPLAKLNQLLCFWLRGNRRKVRTLAEDLFALGLSRDTGSVVSLLRDSLNKRKPARFLGDEGMALFRDIFTRALDLGEKEKALSLLEGLDRECLKGCAREIGGLFYRYGFPDLAEQYLAIHLEADPECDETLFTLAEIKERQGLHLEAGDLYRRALDLNPAEPRYYTGLIRHYESLRRQILREAAARYPEVPVFKTLLEEADNGT